MLNMRHKGKGEIKKETENIGILMAKTPPKCRECRFIDYFTSENKYCCPQSRQYVAPAASQKLRVPR